MTDETASEGALQVDTDLVRQLAALLSEGDLSEIEVQDGTRRIVVKRKLGGQAAAPNHIAAAPVHATPAATAPEPFAEAAGTVKSPMVGTVYLSGEPGAAPFAPVGAAVAAGDTLVIVEAMKVMNPIAAPRAGVVRQVLVVDAQPVEYDQPLVVIE